MDAIPFLVPAFGAVICIQSILFGACLRRTNRRLQAVEQEVSYLGSKAQSIAPVSPTPFLGGYSYYPTPSAPPLRVPYPLSV